MLTDKDAISSALEVLKPEDFYREDNKLIFEAILNLYNRAQPVDIITLKTELQSMKQLESVGGLEYIAQLPDRVPTTANVEQYIKIVEEKSALRALIKTANDLITLGYDQTQEVEDILDTAEKRIFDVIQNRNQKGYSAIKDILVDSFTELEKLYNQKQHITGTPTGFADLDYITAGLHPSDLVIVAARPAMGKSAFALNIAYNVSLKSDEAVAVFSLEMPAEQLIQRIICAAGSLNAESLRSGSILKESNERYYAAAEKVGKCNLYIDDTPGIKISELR
ncbi:MAG: replicative DNA helicase, partial [Clostridia bacterium]|nr:replicative DNA helicase [Clostridia bacterium]